MSDLVTAREYEILVLLAHGCTVRQAAILMEISLQTAKNLLQSAYQSLDVSNRYGAFLELGWLTPPELRFAVRSRTRRRR